MTNRLITGFSVQNGSEITREPRKEIETYGI